MPKYKVQLPTGVGRINAENHKDAIDQAIKIYLHMLDKMVKDGSIYGSPSICEVVKKRNGIEELGNEVPLKPSRWGKRKRRI